MSSSALQPAVADSDGCLVSLPDDPAVMRLVNRVVAARDQVAFGELYDLFLDRIYRYVYYRTGSRTDAEDLTEQVFLKAWTAIGEFRWQGKPFQAWLYRIAHHVLVDHARRNRPTISLDALVEVREVANQKTTGDIERWLDADLLVKAIGQLPADQQHVVALRFLEGRNTTEVARLMDKPESAVRTTQFHALRNLRRLLEKQGEGCGQ